MFSYCGNNPVAYKDENGEWGHIVIGALVGAAIGFVGALITEFAEVRYSDKANVQEFSWRDVLVSTGIGAAEGALTALCPGAAALISAGANMAETIYDGIDDGKNVREIAVNTALSGLIGMAGAGEVDLAKPGIINDGIKSIGNAYKKGVHPSVKKAAKKAVRRAGRTILEDGLSDFGGSFVSGGAYEFTSWYANKIFDQF